MESGQIIADATIIDIENIEYDTPVEQERSSLLKNLEIKYKRDYKLITANDIINISLANSALSIEQSDKYLSDEEKAAKISALRFERDKIIRKILYVTTSEALSDALDSPTDDYVYGGYESSCSELLDQVLYLDEKEEVEGVYSEFTDYKSLMSKLASKVSQNEATDKELAVALKIAKKVNRFGKWKQICDKSLKIVESEPTPGDVEQLLQEIHQGGYETRAGAEGSARPVLENITDRPWEVANALTFTFAGYPSLAGEKLRSSILKNVKDIRDKSGIKEYLNKPKKISLRVLDGVTQTIGNRVDTNTEHLQPNKYLRASLSLAEVLPVEAIEKSDFFVEPDQAGNIIENKID